MFDDDFSFNTDVTSKFVSSIKKNSLSIAHWFRNVKIDQQFENSKNIDFRENIVKQEMSIYAKAKSLLICTIDV